MDAHQIIDENKEFVQRNENQSGDIGMKKKIKIVSISLLLIFIFLLSLPGKNIAGYNYLPYIDERIVISPPSYTANWIQPIIFEEKKEIKKVLKIIHDSKAAPNVEGVVKFNEYLNNSGRFIFKIEVRSSFPERIIAWEYWKENDDKAYLFPTLPLSKARGEAFIVSLEFIEWMDELVKINWPDIGT